MTYLTVTISFAISMNFVSEGYNVTQMFRLAEQFFKDLGLPEMTTDFWKTSLFVKPTDNRRVVCHASAWDFLDNDDFRSVSYMCACVCKYFAIVKTQ